MEVIRKLEVDLFRLINDYPVVGLIGPRQSGKTTLAKMLMRKLDKPSVYLDLENDADLSKLADPGIYLEQYRNHCVIIDEIQRMPALFPQLRSMIDQYRIPGRFVLLGSASPVLVRESAESLAGRIAYLELTPFRLDEIDDSADGHQLWSRGGYPLSFLAENERKSYEWRQFFMQAFIERDIAMSGLSADPIIIRRFLKMISVLHGNLWNTESLSRSLGINSVTVNKYLNFLEHMFLVSRLMPFSNNNLKRLVKSPKIYIRDSGLLHFLNGIESKDDLFNNPILGNSWEGFVINQIQSVIGTKAETFFYRTHQGAECDLVILKGVKIVACIEIKYTSAPKPSKGYYISTEDLNSNNNFLLIPGAEQYQISKNIFVNGLSYFLNTTLPAMISNPIIPYQN
jgi:uncharacterized protein